MLSDTDIAWAAGIIEGEGYVGPSSLAVQMTDEDVIEKLHTTFPGSHKTGPYLATSGNKLHWAWRVGRGTLVREIAQQILPHMGLRRSGKLTALIDRLTRRLDYCRKGHKFTEENSYLWNGQRQCRICRKDASARHERLFRKGKRDYSK